MKLWRPQQLYRRAIPFFPYTSMLRCYIFIFRCRSKVNECDAVRYIARPKTQVTGEILMHYKRQMISSPLCSVCVCVLYIFLLASIVICLLFDHEFSIGFSLSLSLCVSCFPQKMIGSRDRSNFFARLPRSSLLCFSVVVCSCSFYTFMRCLCFSSSDAGLSSFCPSDDITNQIIYQISFFFS